MRNFSINVRFMYASNKTGGFLGRSNRNYIELFLFLNGFFAILKFCSLTSDKRAGTSRKLAVAGMTCSGPSGAIILRETGLQNGGRHAQDQTYGRAVGGIHSPWRADSIPTCSQPSRVLHATPSNEFERQPQASARQTRLIEPRPRFVKLIHTSHFNRLNSCRYLSPFPNGHVRALGRTGDMKDTGDLCEYKH